MLRPLLILLSLSLLAPAQTPKFTRVFSTTGPKPAGPYSPGLWTGERFYVAGQGSRTGAGQLPATPEAQIRQTLDNVKAIIEAAGLTLDHVVSSHVYYEDIQHYELLNRIWREYFPGRQPARMSAQAAALPGPTPFEINAIAVRDKSSIQTVELPGSKSPVPISPAILLKDRAFISGILGRDADAGTIPSTPEAQVAMAFDRLKRVLGAAKLDTRHLISLNLLTTPAMPEEAVSQALAKHIANRNNVAITTTRVVGLPFGANIELHGIATRHLKPRQRQQNCLAADSTVYCGQFTSDDYRTALIGLTGLLQRFPGPKANIVATYVQLDDVKEFAAMNKVYAELITDPLPTPTTPPPPPTGTSPKFRIAVIAEQ
jgi:2-iminobutanoate/2-iminopropanoate deaminase